MKIFQLKLAPLVRKYGKPDFEKPRFALFFMRIKSKIKTMMSNPFLHA